MGLTFSAPDIQAMGLGIVAFVATVLAMFLFFSARKEKLGKPIVLFFAACATWSWFGFLCQVYPSIYVVREMRILSVIGLVAVSVFAVNFAMIYLQERLATHRAVAIMWQVIYYVGTALVGLLISDLFFDTDFVVGALATFAQDVHAPTTGTLFFVVADYFFFCAVVSGGLLAWSAKASNDVKDGRQALVTSVSSTIGLLLIGTSFTSSAWIRFFPLFADLGFLLAAFGVLFAIQRYRLFSFQVAVAQLLVLLLWCLTFFRVLIDPNLVAATPDIVVFVATVLLGIFLLRVVVSQMIAQKELGQLSVEKAKSEFVAIAAHQLRTPLSVLRWSLNLLLTKLEATDPNRDTVSKAAHAADNMMYIINDLLNVSRLSEGHMAFDMKQGDLRDVVKAAVNVLHDAAANKKIALTLDLPAQPISGVFDYDKMVMVTENLIDNAIKYTPEEGIVHVEVFAHGRDASIRVTDTGIGLTAEDRSHVFERFFRSERAKHMVTDGSGLGLYIVKTIVEAHKGHSTLGPGVQKGAIATVDIPLSQSA